MKNTLLLITLNFFVLSVNAKEPLSTAIAAPMNQGFKSSARLDQQRIENNEYTLTEIRKAGLMVFTTPFNKQDGHGDGSFDASNPDNRSPGNRPSLQGNNTYLRVNGLDSQSCLECHTIISNAVIPARLGVGGVGGISQNAMFQPDSIDVADNNQDGKANFNGRVINPPFLFGSGGVELVGLEMTNDLQEAKVLALANPGIAFDLVSKGIDFGSITASANGTIDYSDLVGVNDDLVIKPFGRKGEFATVREFDVGALAFHLGMQATELVGKGVDNDQDGVVDEITKGDLSVLSIFNTTMNRPLQANRTVYEEEGFTIFKSIGCADCHTPQLSTKTKMLPYKLIGDNENPFKDSFYQTDLSKSPASFSSNDQGGINVDLFSDLKNHYMGEDLKESFSLVSDKQNGEFITARLWGVADTAPYLHDGRALTLKEAIELHDNPGSEASFQAQNFQALSDDEQRKVIQFLNTLRAPPRPNLDVLPRIEIRLPD